MEKDIVALLASKHILSDEEEYRVFEYYNTHKTQKMRNLIVLKNQGLVRKLAASYTNHDTEMDDIIQEAQFGLIKAIDLFDYKKGLRFSSYAGLWINAVIRRYLSATDKMIRLPYNLNAKCVAAMRIKDEYELNYGRAPDTSYIAKKLNIPEEKTEELLYYASNRVTSSFNTLIGNDADSPEFQDFIPDGKAESSYISIERSQDLKNFWACIQPLLSEKEWRVLRMRLGVDGLPMRLADCAEIMHMSKQYINKIEHKAYQKIRDSGCMEKFCDLQAYMYC